MSRFARFARLYGAAVMFLCGVITAVWVVVEIAIKLHFTDAATFLGYLLILVGVLAWRFSE